MESIHNNIAVEKFRRAHRLDPQLIRKFRNRFYKQASSAESAALELPQQCRNAFLKEFCCSSLSLVEQFDSQEDGATKLIFRTAAGDNIETVILRTETGRTSLCVSSQVGCAVGCSFCATGQMPRLRNLNSDEIIDQVLTANQLLQHEERRARNIVFMGMGEPLQNYDAVVESIELLTSGSHFNYPQEKILVSTVGIPDAMRNLVERFERLNLALSLHAAKQNVRDEIIPISQRHSLDSLKTAVQEINTLQNKPVMMEYLLLKDLNDSTDAAEALIAWLQDMHVHVNLLRYNAIENQPLLQRTSEEQHQLFAATLRAAGHIVTTRYSLGQDIAAACGQLVQQVGGIAN